MEKNLKQFIDENKKFVVCFLVWFIIHLLLLVIGVGDDSIPDGLWPFALYCNNWGYNSFHCPYTYYYGISDFIVYLTIPLVLLVIWKLVGEDIKEKISKKK